MMMSNTPAPNDLELTPMLAVCKIIAGSLVFGVIAFAAVAIALRLGQAPEPDALMSIIAAVFAAGTVIVRQVLLGVMSGRAVPAAPASETTANSPLGLYQTRMIVGLALLEGAAFFNLIAYLLEGHWWSFLVIAALLAWMLASFPTRSRLRQWIDDREQLKSLGSSS
jgi:hypothetical protein